MIQVVVGTHEADDPPSMPMANDASWPGPAAGIGGLRAAVPVHQVGVGGERVEELID